MAKEYAFLRRFISPLLSNPNTPNIVNAFFYHQRFENMNPGEIEDQLASVGRAMLIALDAPDEEALREHEEFLRKLLARKKTECPCVQS